MCEFKNVMDIDTNMDIDTTMVIDAPLGHLKLSRSLWNYRCYWQVFSDKILSWFVLLQDWSDYVRHGHSHGHRHEHGHRHGHRHGT